MKKTSLQKWQYDKRTKLKKDKMTDKCRGIERNKALSNHLNPGLIIRDVGGEVVEEAILLDALQANRPNSSPLHLR